MALAASAAVAAPLLGSQETVPAPTPTMAAAQPRRVHVASVEQSDGAHGQRFPGTVRAGERATLAFNLGGRLAARSAKVGDRVARGAVIARLDAREVGNAVAASRAELDSVKARLKQQRRDRERALKLWKSGVISEQEHETSSLQLDVLGATERGTQVRLREAQRLLSESVLRAPFAGTIAAVHAERGEMVAPGAPIVELTGTGALEVEVQVPEQTLSRLAERSPIRIDLPKMGRSNLKGSVKQLGRAASERGRLFPVIVSLDPEQAEGVLPGMTAEVVLDVQGSAELSVPVAAVRDPSGTAPSVLQLQGDRVRVVPVRVRELAGERVVVAGALKAGQRVVVAGHAFLLDGDRVAIAEGAP